MSGKSSLRLDWCSREAAAYAVEHWHYSRVMPASRSVYLGVWEGKFIGVIVFAMGANRNLLSPYGLQQYQGCELVRVALAPWHRCKVSRAVAIALRLLKANSPGLRLCVSFADVARGHHGGIYQAGGWVYTGKTNPSQAFKINGRLMHKRLFTGMSFGRPAPSLPDGARQVKTIPKHRYLMPLDKAMREQVASLSQPYPKRAPVAQEEEQPPHQVEDGGSRPTRALHAKQTMVD